MPSRGGRGGLHDKGVARGIHEVTRISKARASRVHPIDRSTAVDKFGAYRRVSARIHIGIRHQRPGIGRKIEHRIAIDSPAVVHETHVQPGAGCTTIQCMNPEGLAGSRGRSVRIVLGNTVDGLPQDINEFVLRGIMGIETVNLCIGILAC